MSRHIITHCDVCGREIRTEAIARHLNSLDICLSCFTMATMKHEEIPKIYESYIQSNRKENS